MSRNNAAVSNMFFVAMLVIIGIAALATIFYFVLNSFQKTFDSLGSNQKTKTGYTAENCLTDECLSIRDLKFPVAKISQNIRYALIRALDGEYKKYATYKRVIEKLGPRRPFIMIARSQEEQTVVVKALFDKYLLDIPENTYLIRDINLAKDFQGNCRLAAEMEFASADLYRSELLPLVGDYKDITLVFSSIVKTSSERYLPAFDSCN